LIGGISPTDTDGDGMPDAWELQYGLNPNNASDSSGDFDQTGYTNIEKYINGLTDGSYTQTSVVVNNTGATISWNSGLNADATVAYGLTTQYGQTVNVVGNTTAHSVTLTNLSPGTKYYYAITSKTGGEIVASGTGNLTTTFPALQLTAGSVSVTSSSATITWTTNNPANGAVHYNTDSSYSLIATDPNSTPSTFHSVTLNNLTPNTTYRYYYSSTDIYNSTLSSSHAPLTTAAAPPSLQISSVSVSSLSVTTATILWTTNISASSEVDYGADATYGLKATGVGDVTTHSVSLSGLSPGTVYHFRVVSTDGGGNSLGSADATFTTAASLQAQVVLGKVTWTRDVSTGALDAALEFDDIGAADADNVQVTAASLGSASSFSAMPLLVGTISGGGNISLLLTFPALPTGTASVMHLSGDFTGGSFSASLRMKAP